jgi:Flp pilus assembly protein CpaB
MRKLNATVIVGVIVAVLGAGMVFAYGQTVDKHASGGNNPVAVLVADGNLAAGAPASSLRSDVHVAQVPSAYAVSGALSSVSALTSKLPEGSVLTAPVPKGGQLSSSSFADPAAAGRVNPAPGHLALAVQTDLAPGVARYLAVGEYVDVFGTYRDVRDQNGKLTKASSVTKLFASHVRVLAVSVAETKSNSGNDNQGSGLVDKTVVLLDLVPADAQRVVNASTLGSIYLAYSTAGHRTPKGASPDDVVSSNR